MKLKISIVVIGLLFGFLSLASVAYGQSSDCNLTAPATGPALCNPIQQTAAGGDSFQSFAIHILFVFAGAVGGQVIVYVMYSGFRFLISQGNSEDVELAKRSLQWSLLGMIVVMLAFFMVAVVSNFFAVRLPGIDSPSLTSPLGAIDFPDLVNNYFIKGFFGFLGTLAMFMIIFNSVRYLTAQGNEEQAENARAGLQYAIGGVIIILLAYVIVRAVAAFFGK